MTGFSVSEPLGPLKKRCACSVSGAHAIDGAGYGPDLASHRTLCGIMREMRPVDHSALARALRPILVDYPEISAVYLFGSVLRGTDSERSDLDLGLLLEPDEPADARHRFLGDLAARLEAVAGSRPVDLVVLNGQGPIFCHEVIREGRVLYESDRERRIDFESDVIVRALDFRPTLEMATKGYLPAFRRWLKSYRDRERADRRKDRL